MQSLTGFASISQPESSVEALVAHNTEASSLAQAVLAFGRRSFSP